MPRSIVRGWELTQGEVFNCVGTEDGQMSHIGHLLLVLTIQKFVIRRFIDVHERSAAYNNKGVTN